MFLGGEIGYLTSEQTKTASLWKIHYENHVNRTRRLKYEKMSLAELRHLRDELQILTTELENGPRREIDIATDHTGDPALVSQVLRVDGDKTSGKWFQVERIFCSTEKCPKCPHGAYHYEYRYNKRKGTTTVRYRGKALEGLDNLRFFEFTEGGNAIIIPPLNEESESDSTDRSS